MPGPAVQPCSSMSRLSVPRAAFRCMPLRGSRALTGRGSNAYGATWPGRPWPRGACASSIRSGFPSRSKRRGRMGPAGAHPRRRGAGGGSLSGCLGWPQRRRDGVGQRRVRVSVALRLLPLRYPVADARLGEDVGGVLLERCFSPTGCQWAWDESRFGHSWCPDLRTQPQAEAR